MNLLDAIVLLALGGAAFAGYRYGFAARALSWLGLAFGLTVGIVFVDDVAGALDASSDRTQLIAALAFLFLAAIIGQTVGVTVGAYLRSKLSNSAALSRGDRVVGAVAGVIAVLVSLWLLIAAFENARGWPARAVRGSSIARAVDRIGPTPPDSLRELSRYVSEGVGPQVFNRLISPEDVGPPPAIELPPDVAARVGASVVRIEGRACDLIQQGSGFVAADGLVATNAHVVAGESHTTVVAPGGQRRNGTVVFFDPELDLALVRVPDLGLDALTLAGAKLDDTGAVMGYPGGGPLEESPARIVDELLANGADIYGGGPTIREIFELAASLVPGDSGSPLVDRLGRVVGLAFAVDPASATTAYALTRDEIEPRIVGVVKSGTTAPVDTGPCLGD